MTRLFTDGAEFGDNLFWDAGTNVIASQTQVRSGIYSYRIPQGQFAVKNTSTLSEFYLRFGIYTSLSSAINFLIRFYTGTNIIGSLRVNADSGVLLVYVGSGGVDTGTNPFLQSAWNLIEIHEIISDVSGLIEVKLNGVDDIYYSGDTKPGGDTGVGTFQFGGVSQGNFCYVDDIALNDTSGTENTSWCGDGHIELIIPVSDDSVQWTPLSGSTNYGMVDEIPPDDDTTYVSASSTGYTDIYGLSSFDGTGKLIKAIYAEGRAKDNDASSGQIKLGFATSGCTVLSNSITLPSTYSSITGSYTSINPETSGSWTESDINNIKFVIECE